MGEVLQFDLGTARRVGGQFPHQPVFLFQGGLERAGGLCVDDAKGGWAATTSDEVARGVVSGCASAEFQPPKTPVTRTRARPARIARFAGDARSEKSLKNRQIVAPRVESLLLIASRRSQN